MLIYIYTYISYKSLVSFEWKQHDVLINVI